MDLSRVDLVMQYALAVSRCVHDDDWQLRDLGEIHLIKYVYLADLAHAADTGSLFTGLPWRFLDFGPYCAEASREVIPAMAGIGAVKRIIPSQYEKDTVRWSLPDGEDAERLRDALRSKLPPRVAAAVGRDVRKFGNATPELLQRAYLTTPMFRARPRERLSFDRYDPPDTKPSEATRQRRLKATKPLADARARVAERARQLRVAREAARAGQREPRYDEVFEEGTRILDSMGGPPLPSGGVVMFGSGVWEVRAQMVTNDDE